MILWSWSPAAQKQVKLWKAESTWFASITRSMPAARNSHGTTDLGAVVLWRTAWWKLKSQDVDRHDMFNGTNHLFKFDALFQWEVKPHNALSLMCFWQSPIPKIPEGKHKETTLWGCLNFWRRNTAQLVILYYAFKNCSIYASASHFFVCTEVENICKEPFYLTSETGFSFSLFGWYQCINVLSSTHQWPLFYAVKCKAANGRGGFCGLHPYPCGSPQCFCAPKWSWNWDPHCLLCGILRDDWDSMHSGATCIGICTASHSPCTASEGQHTRCHSWHTSEAE